MPRNLPMLGVLLALVGPAKLLSAQDSTAAAPAVEGTEYRVYGSDGSVRSWAELLAALDGVEVALVGEQHDDMVAHSLQRELLARALERLRASGPGRPVVLSLEMFERDVQYVVDEYLGGLISEEHFLRSARPWDHYEERYRPIVELARESGIPVVAANAPRRYVNRVSREGPESLSALSERARSYLPPLPYPGASPALTAEWDALMASMTASAEAAPAPVPDSAGHAPPAPRHDPGNALHAQALWDAAMGHAIARALAEVPGALVVHLAGSFHVARGTGIPERIEGYRPGTRTLTVVTVKAEDPGVWDESAHAGLADFVVLTRAPAPPG